MEMFMLLYRLMVIWLLSFNSLRKNIRLFKDYILNHKVFMIMFRIKKSLFLIIMNAKTFYRSWISLEYYNIFFLLIMIKTIFSSWYCFRGIVFFHYTVFFTILFFSPYCFSHYNDFLTILFFSL
jgi:hypothetical protein